MHGGKVLHRSADGRPRSGMRSGLRHVGPVTGARKAQARRRSLPRAAERRTGAAETVDASAETALQREPGLVVARDAWFETVAIAQQRAKKRLPKSAYSSLISASEKGVTVGDNVAAFSELGFAPHVVGAAAKRDLATTVMGQEISFPVMISPTGVQAVDPDGEVAVARAAAARGTAMGLSSFASKPIEEVIAANPKVFFQVYWLGGRDAIAERVERARQAGAVGLIVTTDWSFSHGRDWGSPQIPEEMNLKTMLRLSPEVIVKPRWLWKFGKTMRPPDLRVPNQGRRGEAGPPFFAAYGEWMARPPPSWEDIAWLRELWGGPFTRRGVPLVDDAKRAVDTGVSAISVSNHGGNNLDGTPATIRVLPAVAAAVGDQIDVLLDGGIRRGGDAVKALALGAKAVMIGRASLWGLAANGQAGVENVLDIMRSGIDSALLALGRSSITELTRRDVVK